MSDGFIWYSMTDPGPRSGAKKFTYERVAYTCGIEARRDTCHLWCYSRGSFIDLLNRWNLIGFRPSEVNQMTYSYSIRE